MTVDYTKNFEHHSKTFSFAAKFFGEKTGLATAKLYYFFRYVDDLADEESMLSTEQRSYKIEEALLSNEIINLKQEYGLPEDVLRVFIKYAVEDINLSKVSSEKELISYCYGVASTVGLSMCHIFNVKDPKAFYHAIDLGIAMQLTNMCRDVFEDYQNNRIYLPELNSEDFHKDNAEKIEEIRLRYLALADLYYQSGFQGLFYLPLRARFVIYIAAKLYQHIGHRIKKENDYRKRSYVSTFKKIFLTLGYSFKFVVKYSFSHRKTHEKNLHQLITELPYAHQ